MKNKSNLRAPARSSAATRAPSSAGLPAAPATQARVFGGPPPAIPTGSAVNGLPGNPGAGAPPIYGQTYFNSGAHYATLDPVVLPVDDGGVVKLGILGFPDTDFIVGVTAQNDAMVGNPNFLTPSPTLAEMTAAALDLTEKVTYVEQLKALLRDAVGGKNLSRGTLDGMFKMRGAYVQLISNGNTSVINSAGFAVRANPRPVGMLAPPTDLKLDLNGTAGNMALTWKGPAKARAFNIQCSPADTMERTWTAFDTTTASRYLCTNMELGKVFAFRIAAVGGSTGQSFWSVEVVRMAA